jgi:hypothetical protein
MSETTKINTTDLEGCLLDWAVAKAEGATDLRELVVGEHSFWVYTLPENSDDVPNGMQYLVNVEYSTDWAQAGPIIDREDIAISPLPDGLWRAYIPKGTRVLNGREIFNWHLKLTGYGPLIAAMRCFVASKLGAEVEIPVKLTEYAQEKAHKAAARAGMGPAL